MIAFHKNTSLKQLIGTNRITNNQKFIYTNNVPHVILVDCFAANKFSKQQHLQALKPDRPLQFSTKSPAIAIISSTY